MRTVRKNQSGQNTWENWQMLLWNMDAKNKAGFLLRNTILRKSQPTSSAYIAPVYANKILKPKSVSTARSCF